MIESSVLVTVIFFSPAPKTNVKDDSKATIRALRVVVENMIMMIQSDSQEMTVKVKRKERTQALRQC